ncbi:MAG: four helix bundle protein [Prolixibacteraceae bacterium]|nr:four helix bundle protein [Prolixibacteraceae bacterium]
MMKNNLIQEKSFDFAVRVVKAYQYIVEHKREFILSKQFLRSGTSIGANIEEAIGAQSTADFLAKLAIAYKEARETNYWIRLMSATNYFSETEKESLLNDVIEIQKIIAKIRITTKGNNS